VGRIKKFNLRCDYLITVETELTIFDEVYRALMVAKNNYEVKEVRDRAEALHLILSRKKANKRAN
jgi:hypothetical protein